MILALALGSYLLIILHLALGFYKKSERIFSGKKKKTIRKVRDLSATSKAYQRLNGGGETFLVRGSTPNRGGEIFPGSTCSSTACLVPPRHSSVIQSWMGQEILYCVVFKFNIRRCLSLLGQLKWRQTLKNFVKPFLLSFLYLRILKPLLWVRYFCIQRFSSHSCEWGTENWNNYLCMTIFNINYLF